MAQAKKTNTRKKTTTTSRNSSSGKSSTKKSTNRKEEVEVGFGDYWHAFTKTKAFVPVMVIIVTAVLIGLDLLISWNSFEVFFVIVGVEIIVAACIWLIAMIYSLGSRKRSSDSREVN